MKALSKKCIYNTLMLLALMFISVSGLFAQHCDEATVPNNTAFAKLQDGMGFIGSYAIPCITRGVNTEVPVPLKTFTLIKHLNGDDTVYRMRIESITNLPEGMCWATNKADNTFAAGEGGSLIIRGTTNDNVGQYNLNIVVSFDISGKGTFDRPNENYNKISKSGRMILRVTDGTTCAKLDYSIPGNTAGSGKSSCCNVKE